MTTFTTCVDPVSVYDVEVHRDLRIPTLDPDTTLSADVYLPVSSDPVPALVTVVPYRKDLGNGYESSLRWFAERGYAGVLVDMRGIGSSGGVPRPKYDASEGDDAIAAIEWITSQPWCTGNVGMWGMSYGGIMTLRAASRRPPQLKAIIPVVCTLDPRTDIAHPDGERGDLLPLASWGGSMVVNQLLPPLLNNASISEQRRWQRRLREVEPFILDMAQVGPDDTVWRDRAIDPATITTPAFCVGGWKDILVDALPRVFEQIGGPKKLLMGPWGHTLPQDSTQGPIDFLPMALRWWDHWLRDIDNGVMEDPPVTMFREGDSPGWRTYESWPPTKDQMELSTGMDPTRLDQGTASDPCARTTVSEYQSDPTTGVLSGLRGIGIGDLGLPQDQHDDDMRALYATSAPLQDSVVISGRAKVSVRLAPERQASSKALTRVIVRLAEVDERGRSTFITAGTGHPDGAIRSITVPLLPACYKVRAGNRIRVVLSDSDFPRLTPLADPRPIRVLGIELTAPTEPHDAGSDIEIPSAVQSCPESPHHNLRWGITRHPISDTVEVSLKGGTPEAETNDGHLVQREMEVRATVCREQPEGAITTGSHRAVVRLTSGETVVVTSKVRVTQTALWVQAAVKVDDVELYANTWHQPMPRPVKKGTGHNPDQPTWW